MTPAARGFTLIEVLVAMAVFALVALMTAGLASSALSARSELDVADERLRKLQTARALMKADIGQIVWRPARDAFGGSGRSGFIGGATGDTEPLLAFVRGGWTNTGGEARPSLQYVEYAVVGEALVRRTRAALDPTPNTPTEELTLLAPVIDAGVSFLTGETWQPLWRAGQASNAVLPDAVALELTLEGLGEVRQVFATP